MKNKDDMKIKSKIDAVVTSHSDTRTDGFKQTCSSLGLAEEQTLLMEMNGNVNSVFVCGDGFAGHFLWLQQRR